VRAFIGITDSDWFTFLRGQPDLDEVNFWQPGGSVQFRALSLGEPFLFKLHSPRNFVVGGAFFETSSLLPASLAWETFGVKNGAASFEEMHQRVRRYRRTPVDRHGDYTIGCIVLKAPFFFDDYGWIRVPDDFSLNIVQGKTYDLGSSPGRELWRAVEDRLKGFAQAEVAELLGSPMFGSPQLVSPRLGQGAFRIAVTDAYERSCAMTGEKALPALDVAHILPVNAGGHHTLDNGLLLRSDVHRLFDRGYITVNPALTIRVSSCLKEDFDNGEPYYSFAGQVLRLPRRGPAPRPEFLEWHGDVIYRR
jgi:putative restriction endonuclease